MMPNLYYQELQTEVIFLLYIAGCILIVPKSAAEFKHAFSSDVMGSMFMQKVFSHWEKRSLPKLVLIIQITELEH